MINNCEEYLQHLSNEKINLKIISLDMDETLVTTGQLFLLDKIFKTYTNSNIPFDIVSLYFCKGGARKGTNTLLQKISSLLLSSKLDQCVLFTSASNKNGFVNFVCRSLEYYSSVPFYTISKIISREHQYCLALDGSTIKEIDMISSFYPNVACFNKNILSKIFKTNIKDFYDLKIETNDINKIISIKDLKHNNLELVNLKLSIDDEITLIIYQDQDFESKEDVKKNEINQLTFINGDSDIFSIYNVIHIDDKPDNILPDGLTNINVFCVKPYFCYLNLIEIVSKIKTWNHEIFNIISDYNTLSPDLYNIEPNHLNFDTGKILNLIKKDYIKWSFENDENIINDNDFEHRIIPIIQNFFL